jgi:hypothetical protein
MRQRRHQRTESITGVRFLSAATVATNGKLLTALKRIVVTPDFHELEPDVELAKPAPGTPTSRIVKRGRKFTNCCDLIGARSSVRGSRSLKNAGHSTGLVDQNSASWNQVTGWLQRLELLQRAS